MPVAHPEVEGGEGVVGGFDVKDTRCNIGLAAFGAHDVRREPVEHGERSMDVGQLTWRVTNDWPFIFRGS